MAEKLKKSILYTFGISDFGFSIMVMMEVLFFSAFLTDYAKFSLPMAGQILSITSLLDIICAIVAGMVLQKVTLKFGGKYRSWFLVGPPIVAILFILQFTKIGSEGMAAAIIIFGFVASHLLWNIVYTANVSMVGRLSQLPEERTKLSFNRAQWITAAGLLFSYISMPLIMFMSLKTNPVAGFTIAVAIFSVVQILGYLYLFKITKGKDPYDEPGSTAENKEDKLSVGEILALVFKNPPLIVLILAEVLRNAGSFILAGFAFYYLKYVLNDLGFFSIYLLATQIAQFVGSLVGGGAGVKFGNRNVYIVTNIILAVILVCAKFFGATTISFTAIMCLGSILAGIQFALPVPLFNDSVIYGEWKTGKNTRGFTMGLINFPIKSGVFIRSFVMATGLVAIGFVADAAPTSSVMEGISNIMTLLPAAMGFVAALIIFAGFRIDDKQVLKMQDEIAARK